MKKLLSKKIVACICLVLTVFAVSTSVLATDYELPSTIKHVTIDTLSDDYDFSDIADGPSSDVYFGGINFDYSKFLIYVNRIGLSYIYLPDGYDSFIVLNTYSKYAPTDDKYEVVTLAYNSVTNTFSDDLYGYTLENGNWKSYGYSAISYDTVYYTNSNCKLYYSTSDYYTSTGYVVSSIEPGTLIADFEEEYSKKIVYEITYDENNKKAQINASIKNASEGDTLYYSTLGFKLNGKLLNPHEISQNDISYIPVSENGLIHLQALDVERQHCRYGWY